MTKVVDRLALAGVAGLLLSPVLLAPALRWDEALRALGVIVVLAAVWSRRRRAGVAASTEAGTEPSTAGGAGIVSLALVFGILEFGGSPWARHAISAGLAVSLAGLGARLRAASRLRSRALRWTRADSAVAALLAAGGVLAVAGALLARTEPLGAAAWQTAANIVGAYLLASRVGRIDGDRALAVALPAGVVGLAVPCLLAGLQWTQLRALEVDAADAAGDGRVLASADGYEALVAQNRRGLRLPSLSLEAVSAAVAAKGLSAPVRAAITGVLGAATAQTGSDWERALQDLREALADNDWEDATRLSLQVRRGRVLAALGEWRSLAAQAAAALQQDPAHLELQAQAVVALAKDGQYAEAAAIAQGLWAALPAAAAPLAVWPPPLRPYRGLLSAYETVQVLAAAGFEVHHEAVILDVAPSPLSLRVVSVSGGIGDVTQRIGVSFVEVGDDAQRGDQGYNLVAIPPAGAPIRWLRVGLGDGDPARLRDWIGAVDDGQIVVAFSHRAATRRIAQSPLAAGLRSLFTDIGLRGPGLLDRDPGGPWAHVVVGVKGAAAGTAAEVADLRIASWSILGPGPTPPAPAAAPARGAVRVRVGDDGVRVLLAATTGGGAIPR